MRKLKEAAAIHCELRIFEIGSETRLEVDASKYAVGAVLKQKDKEGKWQPCAFYSKKLTSAETHYDVGKKEFLGLICAIKH